MFNGGVRGKRAKDGVGFLSTAEQFNQKSFLVPTVTSFSVTDVSYVPLDDTAVDTAGGQTIVINGSGFASGATIQVGATTIASVTFVDQSRLAFTAPALSSGSYTIYVTNNNGGTGILVSGLVYSGLPTFTTTAGTLGAVYETANINTAIVATGDAPITYSVISGTLPTGATLNSNGTITGNAPVDGSSTTYSFTIQASDGQLQESTRSFSLTINTDVLTWGLANNTVYTLDEAAMSNVTLTATSSANANSGVTFAANTLPTGVSLSGNTIFGTPTVEETVYSELTATATQTGRTATRFVSWTVSVSEPFFKYVSLLLKGNGTNGAQNNTFLDGSTNNFAITRNGNTTQGTFSPYGSNWSNYFDGTGDSLTGNMAQIINFGTNDFTVEFWVNFSNAADTVFYIFDGRDSSTPSAWALYRSAGGALSWYNGTSNYSASLTDTNVWTHVAWSRSGTSLRTFINGALTNTFTDTTSYTAVPATSTIGSRFNGVEYINGYISNFRIVKGTAVYTSAFTPSTTPLTAIANTSLLTCQSNRFIDNSTNNLTITRNGDVSVQRFSPFSPTAEYSTSTIGGSAYFDGTGDYLSYAQSGSTYPSQVSFLNGSTGTGTIEFWVYQNSSSQGVNTYDYPPVIAVGSTYFSTGITTGNKVRVYWYIGSPTYFDSTGTVPFRSWAHVAIVRNGATITIYINGVSSGSTAYTGWSWAATADGSNLYIGYTNPGANTVYLTGYVSDLRIVNGTANYTSNFTPATTPLTSITNTRLLLNMTNAGIIDNAMINNLETVGNTQISTTQSKFGGSSMRFDGSGDGILIPYTSLHHLSGDFTIEFWVYWNGAAGTHMLINKGGGVGIGYASYEIYIDGTTDNARFAGSSTNTGYNLGGESATGNMGIVPTNTWTHIALTRSGTAFRGFVNGVQGFSQTSSVIPYDTSPRGLLIGSSYATTWGSTPNGTFNGYIDDLRITKGYARYTSNFTPPTSTFKNR
jgi:hypothetical protein